MDESEDQKTAVLAETKRLLENLNRESLATVTLKTIRDELMGVFGDSVIQYKGDIKACIADYVATCSLVEEEEIDEKEDEEEEEQDITDEDEDAEVTDDPFVAALPDEWKASFGEVVWAKSNKRFPWWPAYIYNPCMVNASVKLGAMKCAGKKHCVYYYGSSDFGYVLPKDIKPYSDHREVMVKQKITNKKYERMFPKALELADADVLLSVDERVAWNHRTVRKRKSTKTKTAVAKTEAKKSAPRKTASEPAGQGSKQNTEREDEVPEEDNYAEEEMEEEEEEESEAEAEFEKEDSSDEYIESRPAPKKEKAKKKTEKEKKSKEDKAQKKRPRDDLTETEKKTTSKKRKTDNGQANEPKASKKKRPVSDTSKPVPKKSRQSEEKESDEKQREKLQRMKASNVPVWKQARLDTAVTTGSDGKTKTREPETRVQRARRLTGLIEMHLGKNPANVEGALKSMWKAKEMNLNLEELKNSGFAEALSVLRKHNNSEIASAAKQIRSYFKQSLVGAASASSGTQVEQKDVNAKKDTEVETKEDTKAKESVVDTKEKSESKTNSSAEENEGEMRVNDTKTNEGKNEESNLKQDIELETKDNEAKMTVETTPRDDESLESSSASLALPTVGKGDCVSGSSVALLLNEGSALAGCPRSVVERIAGVIERLCPPEDPGDGGMERYMSAVHKFAFALKDEKYAAMVERITKQDPSVDIAFMVKTPVEEW